LQLRWKEIQLLAVQLERNSTACSSAGENLALKLAFELTYAIFTKNFIASQ
jgi:hypothetical protein